MAGTSVSSSNISTSSLPDLFATDIVDDFVELKNVILNEFHVLRKFLLISLSDQVLRVTLDSDLSSQIGFQLNNENIDNSDDSSGAEPVVATFLADDFCELFNTVNLVNEVVLQPRQVQQVILTFRPSEASNDASDQNGDFKDEEREIQLPANADIQENGSVEPSPKIVYPRANQSVKVAGRLFLSATVLGNSARVHSSAGLDRSLDGRQDIIVHFQATVCRSILKADVQDIVFDDCIPGGVFVKDFSIWNLSEVPCAFSLHVKNGQAEQPGLDLTDYETGLPLPSGEIQSCAHRRIRVMYKPREVGDFSYSLQLENSYDVRNFTCIPVQCIVNAEHRREGLLVTGVGEDGVLDFGDCYANNGTFQLLTVRNITQEALVVNLGTDQSPGDKVNFFLQTELDMSASSPQVYGDDANNQENVLLTHEDESTSSAFSLKLGDCWGTRVNFDKKSRVEEVSLDRGEEKNLLVWFYPAGASDDSKALKLQRRTFRLSLKCVEKKGRSKQRFFNIIQCKARVCTSIVKLSTPEINFGDCNIGSHKSASVEIMNLSDLPALVTSYVTSTVLSFKSKAERVLIPPRQSYSLEIDLVPLKINLKYRKQITIDNFYNKENQQVLEVRAKIMDRHHVLLHSVYYKLRTPSTNNILNFDCAIVNNPSIRTLAIENITDKSLVLGFSTSLPEELDIYQLRDDLQSETGDDTCSTVSDGSEEDSHESRRRAYAALMNKEKLLETLEESQPRLKKAIVDSAPFPVRQGHNKSIPPRPPFAQFSGSKAKTRIGMSLDLATGSPFPSNNGGKALPRVTSGPISGEGDPNVEPLDVVKPFCHSGGDHHVPRPLKRVQSSAMLTGNEEVPPVVPETCQEEVSPVEIEEVLKRLSDHVIFNSTFADEEAEKQYVENQVRDRDLIMHVLEDVPRTLMPVRKLEILPGETKLLYVILRVDGQARPSLQGRLQKQSAKVYIQLLEYDKEQQDLLDVGLSESPIKQELLRELPVYFRVCRALLSLAQKNISFGKLLTNEHRAKTLVLTNISDAPLLYKLKKTGSIASGDLHIINGRTGILRPHSDREVNFVFQPSLGGSFQETLVVSNVYDPSNDQVVTLKATITRADTFWLSTSSIDFGVVNAGEWSRPQSIVVVNNTKQSRTFTLKAGDTGSEERFVKPVLDAVPDGLPILKFLVEEVKKQSSTALLGPEQELIEGLERKALAYERKGKGDKAAKIRKQIEELRARDSSAVTTDKEADVESTGSSKPDKAPGYSDTESQNNQSLGDGGCLAAEQSVGKGSDGYVNLTIKGGESKVVLISIFSSLLAPNLSSQRVMGVLVAYESKNQDVVKKIHYEATMVPGDGSRTGSETVNSGPFSLELRAPVPEISLYPTLLAPSPSLTPESSAPTSPVGGYTPHSGAAQTLSRTPSPDLSSSVSHLDEPHLYSKEGAALSASRSLATSFAQALNGDGWGSKEHILQWGAEEGEGLLSDGVLISENDSSSLSGACGVQPCFMIELAEPAIGDANHTERYSEVVMNFSSAGDLAKSSVTDRFEEPGRAVFAGELNLQDSITHEKREASFTLRSLSAHDKWISFSLAWCGEPDSIELWVRDMGGTVESFIASENLTHGIPPVRNVKLRWEQVESSDSDLSTISSAMLLKSGGVAVVTLVRPDEYPLSNIKSESTNGHVSENGGVPEVSGENGQATGVLTVQARPDDGLTQQLLVRVKHLDRCIRVVPSSIMFPESDFTTVLSQDLVIKNRIGSTVSYTITVTPTIVNVAVENTGPSDHQTTSSSDTPELVPSNESVLSVSPAAGRIEGHGSFIVKATGRPTKPGKQSYNINIRSSACLEDTQVGVTMLSTKVHCLYLPDLPDGGTLDMGFCFINPTCCEKVVPLRLQNLQGEPLLLSFRSNLAKQVYISISAEDLKRADEFLLPASASTTVFVCLRPGGDATAFEGGQCREIIGGMRITARSVSAGSTAGGSPNQEKSLDEIMVKFRAIVGRSLLQVSSSLIDLGRVRETGGFVTGEFLVSNPSTQMPLHFSLASSRAVLSVKEGHLAGKEAECSVDHFEKSDMIVKFSLPVTHYGLVEDKVVVQNLSCPGQTAELILRLFVDSGVVEAIGERASSHFQKPTKEESSHPPFASSRSAGDVSGEVGESAPGSRRGASEILQRNGREGEDAASVRQIRKTASAGDFYFSNYTASMALSDGPTYDEADSIAVLEGADIPVLEINSILNLGTIFISPVSESKTHGRSTSLKDLKLSLFSITDLRPHHASVVIKSRSDEKIELEPYSNLPLFVDSDHVLPRNSGGGGSAFDLSSSVDRDKSGDNNEVHEDTQDKVQALQRPSSQGMSDLVTRFTSCGRPFFVEPGRVQHVFITCVEIPSIPSSELERVSVGKISSVEGLLLFVKRERIIGEDPFDTSPPGRRHYNAEVHHQAVEVMNVVGSLCVSKGKLARSSVDLGKVGYANRWTDVDFEVTVENVSDAVLVYQILDVPDCFKISAEETPLGCEGGGDSRRSVHPRSGSTLKVTLTTSKLEHVKEAGPCSWRICLLNCNNPRNVMELTVEAEMTVCNLRLGGLIESSLLLPPLTLPALPSAPPCVTQFTVENLSLDSLGVALQLQQAEETESLVMLEIISQDKTNIRDLTLGPGERSELRVCARPISDNIPLQLSASRFSANGISKLGTDGGMSVRYWENFSSDTRNMTRTNSAGQELRNLPLQQTDSQIEAAENESKLQKDSELGNAVCLGHLYLFSSPHLPDCISIYGALLPGSYFDVSPRSLHLQARLGVTEVPQRTLSSDDMENVNKSAVAWEGRRESAGTSQIVIRNFRAFECLQFSVHVDYTGHMVLKNILLEYLSVQPLEGSIPPQGSAEITVKCRPWPREVYDTFLKSSGDIESLPLALLVQDVEGQKADRSSESVAVVIRPPVDVADFGDKGLQTPSSSLSRNVSVDEEVSRPNQGSPLVLGLRGCTPVSGSHLCYEFNLGQQNISSGGRLNWDLTLVGDPTRPIQYHLGTISEGDTKWLTITRPKGVVEAGQQTTVQLRFSTKAMGVYSTYLIVENLENPADLKTVHLSLEVVAPRNARPEAPSLTYFHVLVQGVRSEGMVIDMGEVYYNFWYRNRSFAIVNEAAVAMEFLLSSSMDHNDSTELNFSLANTSLKRFSSITLAAKSSARIWIHFCPGPAKEKPISEDTCDDMAANIYVNCRLVKDYQQCIPFRAKCRYPQIGISTTDILFLARRQGQSSNWVHEDLSGATVESISENGPVNAPLIQSGAVIGSTGVESRMTLSDDLAVKSLHLTADEKIMPEGLKDVAAAVVQPGKGRRDEDMELLPPVQTLAVRNLYAHRPLQYIVKNDSLFFSADFPESQVIPRAQVTCGDSSEENNSCSEAFHAILVRPNMENIRTHQKTIFKQKYVEEHLTIYNRSNPREKYTVSLRITAGHLRSFFAAPGRKNSYPFNRLELLITSFLSSFYSLTSHILAGIAVGGRHTVAVIDARSDNRRISDGASSSLMREDSRDKLVGAVNVALEECLESLRVSSYASTDYESLYFDFHYLTDELVFYCLKERWSRGGGTLELATVQLAKLLYCALYRSQIFQVCLSSCWSFASLLGSSGNAAPEDQVSDVASEVTRTYASSTFAAAVGESSTPASSGPETDNMQLGEIVLAPTQSLRFLEDWTGQLRHFLSYFPDSREDLLPLREINQKNQDAISACKSVFPQKPIL
ncbi:hypothetical protein R1sor_020152 [Riccia sorocarpa]|uniref:Uncharacterized protein n=1 Tax=Riccia sorocarpa TaxID=122646 RepID=A0ABD3II82_9MARC